MARSTCPSQNVQSTPFSDDFWKLRCGKSARHCGVKHISKSKCTKHFSFEHLEVATSKKCTPLWREANFQVNMYKAHHSPTTFGSWDVEKVHAIVARSTFPSQNATTPHVRTTFGRSDVVLRGRREGLWTLPKVSKMWGFCNNHQYNTLHCATLHYTTLHYSTLQLQLQLRLQLQLQYNYNTLHVTTVYTTLTSYSTLHHSIFHYTTLHFTTLNYTTLNYTQLHYTTLQLQVQLQLWVQLRYINYITLCFTTLHYTTLNYNYNYTTVHYTILHYLHYTTLHSTTFNYTTTPLHYITLCYITLHSTALCYTTPTTTTTTTTTTTLLYTLHCPTLHYTRRITPLQNNRKYTTPITVPHNYNFTTLQLQPQLHYTTLHLAVVGGVTTATSATIPKKHNSNHLSVHQWIALPSVIHNNQPLL